MIERLISLVGDGSLWAGHGGVLLVLVLCGLGLPMPEDVVLVAGGVLAWLAGPLDPVTPAGMLTHPGLVAMMGTGMLGILAGDSIIYLAGRRYGARIAEIPLLRRIVTPGKQRQVEELMRRRGRLVVVLARFLPGLRAPTYFTVGHARFPYWQFLLFDGAAAAVSAPVWVAVGFYFGDDIRMAAHTARDFSQYVVAIAVAVTAAMVFRAARRRRAAAQRTGKRDGQAGGEGAGA